MNIEEKHENLEIKRELPSYGGVHLTLFSQTAFVLSPLGCSTCWNTYEKRSAVREEKILSAASIVVLVIEKVK